MGYPLYITSQPNALVVTRVGWHPNSHTQKFITIWAYKTQDSDTNRKRVW